MSCNKISGTFSDTPIAFSSQALIYLSSNKFKRAPPILQVKVRLLFLSSNMSQNTFLCLMANARYLSFIDLSNSLLSGEIHNDYWKYMYHLEFLNMSNNKLSRTLPSFDELKQVRLVHLSNNGFQENYHNV